jgi:small subunit ribosomal protein S2
MSDLPKIEELFQAGAHLGHLRGKWNPKMKPYVFTIRNNTYIINLDKTIEGLKKAIDFIKKLIQEEKMILFVGSKRQAKEAVRKTAEALGMPYIDYRWLGGTLTNFETIQKALSKFEKMVEKKNNQEFMQSMTKKEQKNFLLNLEKMEKSFGGVIKMKKIPDALFVVDTVEEKVAVNEANRLKIPIVAIVDSNSDPSKIDYPIPANDDSRKAIEIILNSIKDNCQKKSKLQKTNNSK